jgi:hypothetical protein
MPVVLCEGTDARSRLVYRSTPVPLEDDPHWNNVCNELHLEQCLVTRQMNAEENVFVLSHCVLQTKYVEQSTRVWATQFYSLAVVGAILTAATLLGFIIIDDGARQNTANIGAFATSLALAALVFAGQTAVCVLMAVNLPAFGSAYRKRRAFVVPVFRACNVAFIIAVALPCIGAYVRQSRIFTWPFDYAVVCALVAVIASSVAIYTNILWHRACKDW